MQVNYDQRTLRSISVLKTAYKYKNQAKVELCGFALDEKHVIKN